MIRRRPTRGPIQNPVDYTALVCGLLAGIAQAGIFNPYDRALYLSVKENRPFLSKANWASPYTGFFQSLGGRALSGGLYFPTEHFFLRLFVKHSVRNNTLMQRETKEELLRQIDQDEDDDLSVARPSPRFGVRRHDTVDYLLPRYNFLAGIGAGLVNALVLNPLTAIKYKTWGRDVNRGMVMEAIGMLRKSGGSIHPFVNGLGPTLCRDVVFGGTYTWLRLQIQWWCNFQTPSEQSIGNFIAAGMATIVSGPFNYARNVQYGTSSRERAPSTPQVLQELVKDVQNEPTLGSKGRLIQNRLRIGWGTARVALGMAFAHAVYDSLQKAVRPYPTNFGA